MKPSQLLLGISSEDKERILRTFTRNVYDFHRSKILQVIQHHYSNYETPNDPKFIRLLSNVYHMGPISCF